MNDRDLFELILDQPEPDFPSVIDAVVAGGKRVRRRRRVAALGSVAAVLAFAGLGLALAPSNHEAVRPATPPPASVAPPPTQTRTPPPSTPTTSDPTPSGSGPAVTKSSGRHTAVGEVENGVTSGNRQGASNPEYVPSPPLRCGEPASENKCGASTVS